MGTRKRTTIPYTGKAVSHPAYRQIIEMGQPALPLIFRELERNGGEWFDALQSITGAALDIQGNEGVATAVGAFLSQVVVAAQE